MAEDWSQQEVELTVRRYLGMLEAELRGEPYSKAAHWRALLPQLNGRTKGAIEYKFGNISAALRDLQHPAVDGYKPYGNYQRLVLQVVLQELDTRPEIRRLLEADLAQPVSIPTVDDILAALVDPPSAPEPSPDTPRPREWRERTAVLTPTNYLAREAAHASLGSAGEEFALRFEIARLMHARRERLASQVEHVSRTKGDGAGFDILSFDEDGRERLIEVKTTRYGRHTPFFLSRNEVRTSDVYTSQYLLYRVFDFRRTPKLFQLRGPVRVTCQLEPAVFEASVA